MRRGLMGAAPANAYTVAVLAMVDVDVAIVAVRRSRQVTVGPVLARRRHLADRIACSKGSTAAQHQEHVQQQRKKKHV